MPAPPVDLKQIGKLFDTTLAEIRDSTPDNETLEPEAVAWLKDARYKVMRKIEASYYELEGSRDKPLQRPGWVDPSQPLYVSTDAIPTILNPYVDLFKRNLLELMDACGFHCGTLDGSWLGVTLIIRFPVAPRVAQHPAALPDSLDVDDEFSRMGTGEGRLSGTAFGRLLIGARAEGGGGAEDSTAKSKSRASKKRRASKVVKEESDNEDSTAKSKSRASKKRRASKVVKEESDEESPRLRSMTRASSAATLRSSVGSVRRSGRKRVKTEE